VYRNLDFEGIVEFFARRYVTSLTEFFHISRCAVVHCEEGELQATLRSLPDDSQDVAIAFDVIEHLTKDDVLTFTDETDRVLRPEGRWMMRTTNEESPLFRRIPYGTSPTN